MSRSPLHALAEAADGVAFQPDNTRAVLAWYAALPDAVEAIARMFGRHGNAIAAGFPTDPAAGQYVGALGSQFARFHEPCSVAAKAFHDVHREQIARLDDTRQIPWDVSANQV